MRIAVLSDTHDDYPRNLPARFKEADEIWHLGDVTSLHTLEEFEQLGPPLRVVRGNCDSYPFWPVSLALEREGVNCHLAHLRPTQVPDGVRVVLYGHTHMPCDVTDFYGVRWLNPGCITHPRGGFPPSFAWLELKAGHIERWEVVLI
jgi:hypothetical protein